MANDILDIVRKITSPIIIEPDAEQTVSCDSEEIAVSSDDLSAFQ